MPVNRDVVADGYGVMDRRRRYAARHRALGLCVDCSRPAEPGVAMCAYHRQKAVRQRRRHYKLFKTTGRCGYCGRPLSSDETGYVVHQRQACSPNRRKI